MVKISTKHKLDALEDLKELGEKCDFPLRSEDLIQRRDAILTEFYRRDSLARGVSSGDETYVGRVQDVIYHHSPWYLTGFVPARYDPEIDRTVYETLTSMDNAIGSPFGLGEFRTENKRKRSLQLKLAGLVALAIPFAVGISGVIPNETVNQQATEALLVAGPPLALFMYCWHKVGSAWMWRNRLEGLFGFSQSAQEFVRTKAPFKEEYLGD